MDFFPHLTSVLAALATSATIASLLQQPVGFKKKKKKSFFKFLLFPPILLLWLTAYYYWQYFNVYVALRCSCGAVQVCFARGKPETCKTTQELEDVDLRACPSIMCIQEATCCLQDLTCQCCPVHIMFWFCFSHFQGKKSAALTL